MQKISKKLIAFIAAGTLFIIATCVIVGLGVYYTGPVQENGKEQRIIIKEGMSLKEISRELENKGLIKSSTAFILWARAMDYSRMIKAGEYSLNPAMPPKRIMEMLTRGVLVNHTVTIPEGFSIEQIADVLASRDLINRESFLNYALSDGINKRYGILCPVIEGYLYPDTYQFAKGLKAQSIIDVMVKRFREVIEPLNESIALSGMTLHEVVTLASIIEKETGKAEERPVIASVFLNRLKKNMRLESDPTVIYGIKDFSGNIKKRDLSMRTPYNTYVIKGLPPGPIASPGLDSIKAVLYPAETDYLFFVSKNDGSHYFSRNLREHNRAVYTYQKKRRRR